MKVTKKQFVSNMCIVCGTINPGGLKATFFEMENGDLCCLFTPLDKHQSYPGRTHGGVSSAVLDETIGRAIIITEPDAWAVTVDLAVRFIKPVPLNTPLRAVARVTRNTRRMFEGVGEILLPDNTVAVSARGTYMKIPADKITADTGFFENDWREMTSPNDPTDIDICELTTEA